MAPSVGEQKDVNHPDNRFGHRHSDANNQGHFNSRGRRQRKRQKKMKKDAAPVPTHNYDSPLGSEFESDHEKNIDSAIYFYKSALVTNPKYVEAWHNLGECYETKGEKLTALSSYSKALKYNPDFELSRKAADRLR